MWKFISIQHIVITHIDTGYPRKFVLIWLGGLRGPTHSVACLIYRVGLSATAQQTTCIQLLHMYTATQQTATTLASALTAASC